MFPLHENPVASTQHECRNPHLLPHIENAEEKGDVSADADFGQSDFGHPYWPTLANSDFGQTDFGQKKTVAILI